MVMVKQHDLASLTSNHADKAESGGNSIEERLKGIALLDLLSDLGLSGDRTQESVNDSVIGVAAGRQLRNHVYTPRREEAGHLTQCRGPTAAGIDGDLAD
jgi:hypothetical protein